MPCHSGRSRAFVCPALIGLLLAGLVACRSDEGPPVPATPEARNARIEALERSRDEAREQLIGLIQRAEPDAADEGERRKFSIDPELRRLAEEIDRIDRELAAIAAAQTADRSAADADAPVVIKRR